MLCICRQAQMVGVSGGGGGGSTRPIPGDGGADQLRGIPIIGRFPTDGTRGPEEKGYGRIWHDAEGLVQGSRARDVRDPVVQNHSCCMKESRLLQETHCTNAEKLVLPNY